MLPGFVWAGAISVLFQLLVIAGLAGYLQYRRPVTTRDTKRRVAALLAGGSVLLGVGWLVSFGSLGSLRVSSAFSFSQVMVLQDLGLVVVFLGYLGVVAGFVGHFRAGRSPK